MGGGSSLNFAVKVPNFVILMFASGSSEDLRRNNSKKESQGKEGREPFIN